MTDEPSARRAITRDKLVTAAITVFAERGVQGATVEQVCETAGFTRGAFYSNFASVNELCVAILDHWTQAYLEVARSTIAEILTTMPAMPVDLDQLLRFGVNLLLTTQGDDRTTILARIALRLHAIRDADFRADHRTLVADAGLYFMGMVEQATKAYGYRFNVTLEQATTMINGVFEMGALDDMLRDRETTTAARAEVLVILLRSMLEPV